jgi:glycosyltransferase involved in cell wall biosynthesis
MREIGVDARLTDIAPVVKFMHGYFGTCISGSKMHAFPSPRACERRLGPACGLLYFGRRCGAASPIRMAAGWHWATSQRTLFDRYAAVVVASEHMRREYVRNGADAARVHTNPLFATRPVVSEPPRLPDDPHVVFLGRMTTLKGGDLLVRAVADATLRLGRAVRLTMVGDGPQRREWEALAVSLGVRAAFPGWLGGDERWPLVATASILAIPSVWPEPFGLVGLEAGALGVAAIAFETGGIDEWLTDGRNGVLVNPPASPAAFGAALASVLADRPRLTELRARALARAADMTVDAHLDRLQAVFDSVAAAPRDA